MVNDAKQSVLKNKDGKFVTVRKLKTELQLCVVDSQTELSVSIETRAEGEKNQVAFRFKRQDGYYSPKVVGQNNLKIEKTTELTNSHWFEKVDIKAGAYYGLKSVCNPTQYLCVVTKGKKKVFSLRNSKEDCALLRDEEEGSST